MPGNASKSRNDDTAANTRVVGTYVKVLYNTCFQELKRLTGQAPSRQALRKFTLAQFSKGLAEFAKALEADLHSASMGSTPSAPAPTDATSRTTQQTPGLQQQ